MLNCHEATFLMSQRQDRTLSLSERIKIRLHAGMCRGCANFERQMSGIRAATRQYAKKEDDEAV